MNKTRVFRPRLLSLALLSCTLVLGACSQCPTPPANGGNNGGNNGGGTITDTTAPTVTVSSPGAGSSVTSPVQLSGKATDNVGVTAVRYSIDGAAPVNLTVTSGTSVDFSSSISTLQPGSHTISVVAVDAAGNTSVPVSVTITLTAAPVSDTTAPTVTLSAPLAGGNVSGPLPLTGKAQDNVGVTEVRYTVDGGAPTRLTVTPGQSVDFATTLYNLTPGSHTISVVAVDAAGNTSAPASVTVNVTAPTPTGDTTAPTLSLSSPTANASVSNPVALSGVATDNVGIGLVRYTVDGGAATNLAITPGKSVNFAGVLSGLTPGAHTISVVAVDTSGNTSAPATVSVTVTTPAPTGDTTAPTVSISTPSANASLTSPFTLSGTATDNVGVSSVRYSVDGGAATSISITPGKSVNYTTSLSGLTPGAHTISVVGVDAAGNTSAPATVRVTVTTPAPTGDTTAPTVSISTPTANASVNSPFTLSGTATDNVGVTAVRYSVDGGAATNISITPGKSVNYTTSLSGLTPGAHTISVVGVDAAGNTSAPATVSVTVTTPAPTGDTTAPTVSISTPTANASLTSPFTLSGTATDNVGVTAVRYSVDGGAATNISITPGKSVNYTTSLSGLTPGAHTISVVGVDAAGNTSAPASVTVNVFQTLTGAGYNVSAGIDSLLVCLLCGVSGENNVIDSNLGNEASLVTTVGVSASAYVRVTGTPVLGAGTRAGYVVRRPVGLLDANLLEGVTLITRLGGQIQESVTGGTLLNAEVLTQPDLQYVSFKTTKAYDSIEIRTNSLVRALTDLRVRYALIR